MRAQIKELDQETTKAYGKYAEGKISAKEYKAVVKRAEHLLPKLYESKVIYQQDLADTETVYFDNMDNLKKILKYSQINELTQEMADDFIHKIKVSKFFQKGKRIIYDRRFYP